MLAKVSTVFVQFRLDWYLVMMYVLQLEISKCKFYVQIVKKRGQRENNLNKLILYNYANELKWPGHTKRSAEITTATNSVIKPLLSRPLAISSECFWFCFRP